MGASWKHRFPIGVITTHFSLVLSGEDLLRRFWELEERTSPNCTLTLEERAALKHFNSHHTRDAHGRFIVPLPKRSLETKLGESRSQAVRTFLSFERSLHAKEFFSEVQKVIDEYLVNDHAEEVPMSDLEKPVEEVFYLPVHVVHKESSTTTKIRAVFDASASTSSGISLNDTLMVGPTVHPSLVDVLIRFRAHRTALIADVSRMYRAILLTPSDKDLHRFVWRDSPNSNLKDYRMTRVTFGVSASSFIANMCVKQNSIDLCEKFPNVAKEVERSFYVDDYLGGADSPERAISLQDEMQSLFQSGGFLLRKWNSNDPKVLDSIAPKLRDSRPTITLSDYTHYTKTLGIEWSPLDDHFRASIVELPAMIKRSLVSDVAKHLMHWDGTLPPSSKQRYFCNHYGLLKSDRMIWFQMT